MSTLKKHHGFTIFSETSWKQSFVSNAHIARCFYRWKNWGSTDHPFSPIHPKQVDALKARVEMVKWLALGTVKCQLFFSVQVPVSSRDVGEQFGAFCLVDGQIFQAPILRCDTCNMCSRREKSWNIQFCCCVLKSFELSSLETSRNSRDHPQKIGGRIPRHNTPPHPQKTHLFAPSTSPKKKSGWKSLLFFFFETWHFCQSFGDDVKSLRWKIPDFNENWKGWKLTENWHHLTTSVVDRSPLGANAVAPLIWTINLNPLKTATVKPLPKKNGTNSFMFSRQVTFFFESSNSMTCCFHRGFRGLTFVGISSEHAAIDDSTETTQGWKP